MRKATKTITMLCTYRPKKGKEKELFALVKKHWRTLRSVGLATKEPATLYRATDKQSAGVYFVEIFSWRDEQASAIAHQTPEVMAIWEPMMPLLASMELAIIEPVRGNS
jgi:quinol monooxygenase YgiN